MKQLVLRLIMVGGLAFLGPASLGKLVQVSMDEVNSKLENVTGNSETMSGALGPDMESIRATLKSDQSSPGLYQKLRESQALAGPFRSGRSIGDTMVSLNMKIADETTLVWRYFYIAERYCVENERKVALGVWLLSALMALLSSGCLFSSSPVSARFFSDLNLRFSVLVLLLSSIAVLVSRFFARWAFVPFASPEFFSVGGFFAVVSVLILRRIDPDYPSWNRLGLVLSLPLVSLAVAYGWDYALITASGPALR